MPEKSKMSVAEILAAARKADANNAQSDAPAAAEGAPAEEPAATPGPAATEKPNPTPARKPGGGRLSVAEMLAAARAEKQGGGAAPAAVPKEKPAAKATAPAAKAAPAKKEAAPAKSVPVETQSILAAARSGAKPGPMTKAEARAKAAPDAKKAKAKEAIVVPPMPVRPDYAKPKAAKSTKAEVAERRAFLFGMSALALGFTALAATIGVWTLGIVRFMFPNILREPPSRFLVGTPDKFPPGMVEERFKAQFGVWIVNAEYNGEQQIVALKSVCTHLGCTPNWLEAEQKFKCPCHGSGFYKDGINFEGPAPRPLERYAIGLASNGEIEVDKSRTFQEEMGQWSDPTSYIPV